MTRGEVEAEIAAAISTLTAIDETIPSIPERTDEDGQSGVPRIYWPACREEYGAVFTDKHQRLRSQNQRFWIGRDALIVVKRAISFLLPVRTGTVTPAGGKS